MTTIQALILGIVQGLTEFLPVSSSGHLVLVPWWLGWDSPGLAFDALLHWGTLLAVLVYFWRDWLRMFAAVLNRLRGKADPEGQDRLFFLIIIGTIPAAVLGYLLEDFFTQLFETPAIVPVLMVATGVMLVLAERLHRGTLPVNKMGIPNAIIIGFAQALAIAPGISRSGATMSAGLWRGLDRPAAARFSFLLGTPIIFGAGLFKLPDLLDATPSFGDWMPLIVGFLAAAISGFLCIRWLLRYLQGHSFYIFAIWTWIVAGLTFIRLLWLGS
ncbi:MAG: undecaprenyl-diphosphatase UppP [Caldilineales bacterium]|nr:undecaprenyl-diphosphatase UppP [Caldilineales bacterium]